VIPGDAPTQEFASLEPDRESGKLDDSNGRGCFDYFFLELGVVVCRLRMQAILRRAVVDGLMLAVLLTFARAVTGGRRTTMRCGGGSNLFCKLTPEIAP
jgi:hypothetical protein